MEPGDIGRKIYGLIVGHPMNVSSVDDHVIGSARPMSEKELGWLVRAKGVKAVLSVTEAPLPQEWISLLSAYKHVQVKNHTPPTIPQLREAVDFVEKNVQQGNTTAVHCAAGKGRTGTVLAAYFCATKHIPAEEAIEKLRAKRNGSVEKNSGQEEAVKQFCLSSAHQES